MPRFRPEVLADLATEVLFRIGSSRQAAQAVAEHLAGANLSGHDSHGLIRLSQYCAHARDGTVVPSAVPEVVRQGPTTALIDGHLAWGQVVAQTAADLALKKAREHALAAVAARNSYHIGRAGVHLLAAARAGFIGQLFCNGHGFARVAPWGGTDSRLATNPVAFAIPTRGEPMVADFATSTVAEGKVRLARAQGKRMPEGWVMDAQGRPTTDPAALYEGGTLLPLGGREGHKGYCLSVVVDALGGFLSGAGAGLLKPRPGNGLLIQVLDPRAFASEETFLNEVDDYIAYLKASPRKPGVEEILLPGEPERRTEARRRREGIELDDDTWQRITSLAAELGVTVPSTL